VLVSLWMSRPPITIRPEASISDAAVVMDRRRIRRLLVTADGTPAGRLIGIVSSGDVARGFPPDVNPHSVVVEELHLTRTVQEVMTARPTTITAATPIEEAARLLRARKVGALPVVHEGRAIGIVTESDVFRAFVEILAVDGPGLRVTFDVGADEDVFALVAGLAGRHDVRVVSVLGVAHEGRPMALVRLTGAHAERFVDAVARAGRRLVSVLVTPG